MKLGADRGFFVERAALCIVTSRLFSVERPAVTKAGINESRERLLPRATKAGGISERRHTRKASGFSKAVRL